MEFNTIIEGYSNDAVRNFYTYRALLRKKTADVKQKKTRLYRLTRERQTLQKKYERKL